MMVFCMCMTERDVTEYSKYATHRYTYHYLSLRLVVTIIMFKCCSSQIDAHQDDANAVSFADETSNIIFSGGDDGVCKVCCSTASSLY